MNSETETPSPKKRTAFQAALRLVRIIMGFTVLLIGIIMIVAPGPATIVIPVGLAILATEYAWARRYLQKFKEGGEKLGTIFFRKRPSKK
jgi:tellurite resistance protein TerC